MSQNTSAQTPIVDWLSKQWFSLIHGQNLVYNACWEDPRIDRAALDLGPDDTLLTITSAGCNALDFALAGPKRVYAVDINYRQNALLELKMAGIRALDFETFFAIFGEGRHENFDGIYRRYLRPQLSAGAAEHWDRHGDYFTGRGGRGSFYFRGASGMFAHLMNRYIDITRLREALYASFAADSVAEQAYLYQSVLRDGFWTGALRNVLRWDLPFALLGVPRAQRRQLEDAYQGGMCGFLEQAIETVFARLPLRDNYFWWLYVHGGYTRERCPEYLTEAGFQTLKEGAVDCISFATASLAEFMESHPEPISRFVLLDHMDWLQAKHQDVLEREWTALFSRASADARILWRSACPRGDFVNDLTVETARGPQRVGEALVYHEALAKQLHALDRVQTYASFHVTTLSPGFLC